MLPTAMLAMVPAVAMAQAANWDAVVAAAKKEGRVQFYGSTPVQAGQRVLAGFRKAYPDIAIDYTRLSSGEMMTRIPIRVLSNSFSANSYGIRTQPCDAG